MANEYIDRKIGSPEALVSGESIAAGLLEAARLVADKSKEKSVELKDEFGSRQEVKRQIKLLLQRFEIMSKGILPNLQYTTATRFDEYLTERTSAMNDSFDIVFDNQMLAGMIDKYGAGIQGNMIVNRLLTPEAAEFLSGLKVDYSNEEES